MIASGDDWVPPTWAVPPASALELQVEKEGKPAEVVSLSRFAATVFGRNTEGVKCGAVTLNHDSISRRHAVIVHDMQQRTHVMDLGSRHGTRVDGKLLAPRKYCELRHGSSITFGASTRAYRLQPARSAKADEPRRPLGAPPPPPSSKAGGDEPAQIDLTALRRLGPAARAKLSVAEQRALQALSTLDDDDDPMAGYVDEFDEFDGAGGERGEAGGSAAGAASRAEGKVGSKRVAEQGDEAKRKRHSYRRGGEGEGRAKKREGDKKSHKHSDKKVKGAEGAPAAAGAEKPSSGKKGKHDKHTKKEQGKHGDKHEGKRDQHKPKHSDKRVHKELKAGVRSEAAEPVPLPVAASGLSDVEVLGAGPVATMAPEPVSVAAGDPSGVEGPSLDDLLS
ncbi:hypothetical protein T492DRAFT_1051602 [Pavlovales sp. CCMP2436]|nr:hypothetical protein T492DRAFT_1051602 [Pavlovales sp. CCMP2436]|mmetsp:Transcript_22470/g.57019  ORF Transcript_22470/g.57019 Transcript_22470/m.57019 type:complete len:393 (-) Transcript_22470:85-1263(-)